MNKAFLLSMILAGACVGAGSAASSRDRVKTAVDTAVRPVMAKYAIPGMSVGVIVNGTPRVFNYGLADAATKTPVTNATMFELGSISKTLTGTLTSYAQLDGTLSLQDPASKYLPALRGTQFGEETLLNLGTHTTGGLPLQVQDDVQNTDQLLRYLQAWRPEHPRGTYRTYSNVSIGLLGVITAKSMGQDFDALMERKLLPALGMTRTFINVPSRKMADYAEGYRKGKPIRMAPGMLSSEAYGEKSTASDMLRFLGANMDTIRLDPKWQRAITNTHTGYFKAPPFVQDLIWEQYRYPVSLSALERGNASEMIFTSTPVTALTPPEKPGKDVWINKTGSTNGFGAYVAYIPGRRCGVVLLANENYPLKDRVALAYKILTPLCGDSNHAT